MKESKEIWFVSHYAMPPHLEQRIKTLKFAEIFSQKGYKTKIFSASTIHNTDINLIEGKEKFIEKNYDGIDYVHIKTSKYKGNGISRIINLFQFGKRFKKVAKRFDKPYAVVADVNCINYKSIYKYCKKNNVKFYSDVRDLWPESIVGYLGYSPKNPIIKYLYLREKKLYKASDGIIFSFEGGRQYIIDKGWDKKIDLGKVHYINNGVDLAEFEKNKNEFTFADEHLDSGKFKVVYTGSIRQVNNIGLMLDVAKLCHRDIFFLIYGNGDEKEMLEKRCIDENINNVVFKGSVDKKYIPFILSKSDLNYINVQPTDLTKKYGTSLNKLFDYLASGKPIVSNLNVKYNLVEHYKCGLTAKNGSAEEMAELISQIYNLPENEYQEMCKNAKIAAKDFDFDVLTQKLVGIIEGNETLGGANENINS